MMQADLSKRDLGSLACGFFGGQTLADDVTRKCVALFTGLSALVFRSRSLKDRFT